MLKRWLIPVGLRVSGRVAKGAIGIRPGDERGFVFLRGDLSNTFTGDTEVLDGNVLLLNKNNGATAIQGDIFVGRGGAVTLWQSNQIADTSTVTLDGRQGMAGFAFDMMTYELTERFHQLVVRGESRLLFHHKPNQRTLFLDDLLIEEGGILYVGDWEDGVTKLLVRKDSEHLSESLKRIVFENYKTKKAGLSEYDKDYWEISPGFPEPTTYGTILVGLVGVVAVKPRRKVSTKKPRLGGRGGGDLRRWSFASGSGFCSGDLIGNFLQRVGEDFGEGGVIPGGAKHVEDGGA